MKIRLQGITKALEDKVPEESGGQFPDLSHLSPTPETDEEITRANLYVKRMMKPRSSCLLMRTHAWWWPLPKIQKG